MSGGPGIPQAERMKQEPTTPSSSEDMEVAQEMAHLDEPGRYCKECSVKGWMDCDLRTRVECVNGVWQPIDKTINMRDVFCSNCAWAGGTHARCAISTLSFKDYLISQAANHPKKEVRRKPAKRTIRERPTKLPVGWKGDRPSSNPAHLPANIMDLIGDIPSKKELKAKRRSQKKRKREEAQAGQQQQRSASQHPSRDMQPQQDHQYQQPQYDQTQSPLLLSAQQYGQHNALLPAAQQYGHAQQHIQYGQYQPPPKPVLQVLQYGQAPQQIQPDQYQLRSAALQYGQYQSLPPSSQYGQGQLPPSASQYSHYQPPLPTPRYIQYQADLPTPRYSQYQAVVPVSQYGQYQAFPPTPQYIHDQQQHHPSEVGMGMGMVANTNPFPAAAQMGRYQTLGPGHNNAYSAANIVYLGRGQQDRSGGNGDQYAPGGGPYGQSWDWYGYGSHGSYY